MVAGVFKGGTSAAANNLGRHKDIEVPPREIHFFNRHWGNGVDWYRKRFRYNRKLVGEKTPSLLFCKEAHRRMRSVVPKAKLIVLLRNPITRAFSHWRFARQCEKAGTPKTFEEGIKRNLEALAKYDLDTYYNKNINFDYVGIGLYLNQLEHLLRYYPREQIFIAISERVKKNMRAEYNKMARFLGVGDFPQSTSFATRNVGKSKSKMQPVTSLLLRGFYQPHNEKLFELLGYDIPEWA